MQKKAQATTDYAIEREFLGDITVTELVEQIVLSHIFSPSGQKAALSQKERKDREPL